MDGQDFNHKLLRVARTIKLKLLFKTPVLVATNTKRIVQLDAFAKFE